MSTRSQRRALKNYRTRLAERGMVRFEVIGLDIDRELLRFLARRLAEANSDAGRIRAAVRSAIADVSGKKGGILAALRRSPLVGADVDTKRAVAKDRKIDL
jgi:hypothetical protein